MKAPPAVKGVYEDLRKRRLLPVVGLLLVALIAIPILLGGGSEPEPVGTAAPSAAVEAAAAAPELDPVVLADVPGIRNFEQRLDEFRKRNPFRQQLTGAPKALEDELGSLEDSPQQVSGGGSGGATASGGSTTSTSTSTSTSTPSSSSDSGGGNSSSGGRSEPELILYSWTIDAKVGQVGDAEKRKGIKQLDFLPGKQRPIVQFIRGDFGENEAVFVVSRSVDSTEGDGRCAPNRRKCEFLLLKVGQEHRFTYGPNGKVYRLKLTAVHLNEDRVKGDDVSSVKKRMERRSGYEDLKGRITE